MYFKMYEDLSKQILISQESIIKVTDAVQLRMEHISWKYKLMSLTKMFTKKANI